MKNSLGKILVTGAAGFMGSHFVRSCINKGYPVIAVDKLTYAGDFSRIADLKNKLRFYRTDLENKIKLSTIINKEKPDYVAHFAAETHVDRSLSDIRPFIGSNIIGTQNLIDCCLSVKIKKFVHISTDEVYGESTSGRFTETSPLRANNPYAATKLSAELLVLGAWKEKKLPAVVIRPSNNYGSWQHPEKLIPVVIVNALKNKKIPVYGKGQQIREWIYVDDCICAIWVILKKGKVGGIYNVGSSNEQNNLKTVQSILRLMNKNSNLIRFVKDRQSHDFRYSLDSSKIERLGWRPKINLKEGLKQTVAWYRINKTNDHQN